MYNQINHIRYIPLCLYFYICFILFYFHIPLILSLSLCNIILCNINANALSIESAQIIQWRNAHNAKWALWINQFWNSVRCGNNLRLFILLYTDNGPIAYSTVFHSSQKLLDSICTEGESRGIQPWDRKMDALWSRIWRAVCHGWERKWKFSHREWRADRLDSRCSRR